ncbi:hypothetical protein GUJ93_ZPchr0001g32799 [Zizania palustris]|uniref:Uncharacterized protein n=1 Tax=Zizania palustris TaxID=103762 RepID=A0A8J5VLS6_ZIZPA|nr:hypothetical protein GUJ93_ZPchr0001g32799 [Zizania palustris]
MLLVVRPFVGMELGIVHAGAEGEGASPLTDVAAAARTGWANVDILVVVDIVRPILPGSYRTTSSPAPGGSNEVALVVIILFDLGGGEVNGKVSSTEGEGASYEPLFQGFRLGVGGVRVRVGIHGWARLADLIPYHLKQKNSQKNCHHGHAWNQHGSGEMM